MRKTLGIAGVLAMCALMVLAQRPKTRTISLDELRDKIEGGWAGQMIGVSFGAPTEFRFREQIIEGALPEWKPERISNSLNQDDLYVDMTFAKVLDDKGIGATTEDFGAMFKDAQYALWHANLAARRALKRGVSATLTGTPKYNAHANDIDFQIEADFIGLMAPALPQSATDIAHKAGRVMNYGDGIYGGVFVSCMYSAAFFETNPRKVVEAGLACLPRNSPYALTIADVLDWSKQNTDWKATWKLVESKWNTREPCPEGAKQPFNIDAKLNGAYIALGLLYGNSDFWKTLEISTRAGQDSDCNPSNACGVLGTMLGYKRIPNEWKSGIPAIAGQKFRYTEFTFESIVDSTLKRAIALAESTGGKRSGDVLTIATQAAKPPKLEIWDDFGTPAERIAIEDPRWQWKGDWQTDKRVKRSSAKGSEASIEFEGSGAIVVGPYLPNGGKADVYLDGRLDRTVDVFPDEKAAKSGESVWHVFGLKRSKHVVRVSVRGEPYPGASGSEIGIQDFGGLPLGQTGSSTTVFIVLLILWSFVIYLFL
ncbi:MAG TPA: ADP-ribosylglycohydrolase family protein [Bryobacteraceae bacterium]|nr:ADP-ribosylglycohydrolase family protein [Bryobacteraceae bacterium]